MKPLFIEINGLPHCPRNRSHAIFKKGKASFLGKTEAAHSYEKALLYRLKLQEYKIINFASQFDPKTQHLIAIWEFHSPEVLTKDGRYSMNGTDLDAHKVLQDTIFRFIGIDDAYIVRDTRTKVQGNYSVKLDLRIVNNDGSHLL